MSFHCDGVSLLGVMAGASATNEEIEAVLLWFDSDGKTLRLALAYPDALEMATKIMDLIKFQDNE